MFAAKNRCQRIDEGVRGVPVMCMRINEYEQMSKTCHKGSEGETGGAEYVHPLVVNKRVREMCVPSHAWHVLLI